MSQKEIDKLSAEIEEYPDIKESYFLRALEYNDLGESQKAITDFTKVLILIQSGTVIPVKVVQR